MANKENFEKEKVQVQWETKLKFTEDAKALKPYADDADALIKIITKATDDWAFKFKIAYDKKKDTAKITGVEKITYPQTNNGHQGESGHDWQWQLDVKSMGKGSKVRLYADDVKAKITKQDQLDKKVKVGKDDFIVVECTVEVSGEFTAGQKH
jgi:hypothetical protein